MDFVPHPPIEPVVDGEKVCYHALILMPGQKFSKTGTPTVGVDARTLFFGQQTGVSRYLRNLLAHLLAQDHGIRFLLYAHDHPPCDAVPPEWRNCQLRVVPGVAAMQKRLWENTALPRALQRDRADVFFSPAYVLPLLLPCPAVVTVHDISYEVHPEWFPPIRTRYLRLLSRRSVARARLILTVSEFSRSEICRHYGVRASRVRAIHEAAEARFFEPVPADEVSRVRRKYGLPERFLLFVGSVHQRRQIPEIAAAVASLARETGSPWHLAVAGHNNYYPPTPLSAIARRAGAEGLVHFLDFVPEEDLLPLYAGCGFAVYVSRYEGFGLPVLEAMAAGKAVLTSNTTALAEIAGDAALLVDPESSEAIAEGVRRLIHDTELRDSLGARGRTHAGGFSWRRAAVETLEALRECLSQPPLD